MKPAVLYPFLYYKKHALTIKNKQSKNVVKTIIIYVNSLLMLPLMGDLYLPFYEFGELMFE